jgi:nanoRNase/pAp phosphatase (c-di-AMP/oligoRNAs hydrolase)
MMTEYLRAAKIKPSPRLATALFYGIKTDTDNFARPTTPNDINAFRYLYPFANINMIKKIESSEITRKSLNSLRTAMENLVFVKDKAVIHMGKVNDPDSLVIIADFFLKMAEATWCIVSGVYGQKLIVIFRNAGFRLDAGKTAKKLFGKWGSAGGHSSAARAEVPIQEIRPENKEPLDLNQFMLSKVKEM